MTTPPVLRDPDGGVWSRATWLAPFVFQIAVALVAFVGWLTGKFTGVSDLFCVASGTGVTLVALTLAGWLFIGRDTVTSRAVGYSVLGCAAAIVSTGTAVALMLDG